MKLELCALASASFASLASAQAPLYDLSGSTDSNFGAAIASLGDVDLDGFEDFAVGAPGAAGLEPGAGCVHIMSARTGATLRTIPGEHTDDAFGYAVAGLGDVDGDGAGDLVIGAPWHDGPTGVDSGAVYVVSGGTGAPIWMLGGNAAGDHAGFAVAGPGDVDGDGVPDYAYSLPFRDQPLPDGGIVWISSGATHGVLRVYPAQQAGELFGFALAAAGDVNGDGVPDLACGAPRHDVAPAIDDGRGYVLSGATSGVALFSRDGGSSGAQFGYSAAGLGDADGDGVRDVAFGAPFHALGTNPSGRVRVLSGAVPHATIFEKIGSSDERLGWSIAGLPDADGDGYGDLLVGSPFADTGPIVDNGRVDAFSPRTNALLYSWNGYVNDDQMGLAVAFAGDLNADGRSDMASGAPLNDHPTTDAGWVRTILGSAPTPVPYCVGKTSSQGCSPWILYTGCPSVSIGDNFHLHAAAVLAHQPGILIWSLGSAAMPFLGGTLCLAPPIHRTPPQTAGGSGTCGGTYDFHFSQSLMALHGLSAGTSVYAQYWYRDPGLAAPTNIGLTNALTFHLLP